MSNDIENEPIGVVSTSNGFIMFCTISQEEIVTLVEQAMAESKKYIALPCNQISSAHGSGPSGPIVYVFLDQIAVIDTYTAPTQAEIDRFNAMSGEELMAEFDKAAEMREAEQED